MEEKFTQKDSFAQGQSQGQRQELRDQSHHRDKDKRDKIILPGSREGTAKPVRKPIIEIAGLFVMIAISGIILRTNVLIIRSLL